MKTFKNIIIFLIVLGVSIIIIDITNLLGIQYIEIQQEISKGEVIYPNWYLTSLGAQYFGFIIISISLSFYLLYLLFKISFDIPKEIIKGESNE